MNVDEKVAKEDVDLCDVQQHAQLQELRERADKVASVLKVLSHSERLMVVCQLIEGEKGVPDLLQTSCLNQSALSQHLKVLRDNELVQVRKQSQKVFYSLKNKQVEQLVQSLYQIYCV
ncbi:transcriptional regulator [Vibrio sp. UCD-FRSSP16_10]|uniref:ArsR/SmtB family transcription factor n=1 Tax=unclassified Vibrio TaxID=2614977 RepID=UPI000802209F|nr:MULTISPECIES: metalloregulator ArsR/SmtB family transcription factor [unclassified Vibrio]OBT07964.1 transcriptional regulator [Vibrio sp. UCD-FRSSP16_30]OBT17139.1 transcriptional regulator [Vibrio sp. UCD-FRSSP16_10]